MPPLPVEIDADDHPDAELPGDEERDRGDRRQEHIDQRAVLAETLLVETDAGIGRDHMVVAKKPQIEGQHGPEQPGHHDDGWAGDGGNREEA